MGAESAAPGDGGIRSSSASETGTSHPGKLLYSGVDEDREPLGQAYTWSPAAPTKPGSF